MFVYTTMAQFSGGSEIFSNGLAKTPYVEGCKEEWTPATEWQELGTLLIYLINADFENLGTSSPILSLYTDKEIAEGCVSTEADQASATLLRIKNFIDFFEQKQIAYDRSVFLYLWNNGYFLEDTSILVDADTDFCESSLWDAENDCIIEDLEKIYKTIVEEGKKEGDAIYLYAGEYRIWASALVSLMAVVNSGKQIKKCKNCGKYFIPSKRSDTLYCNNPSPEAPEMTCKEYGTRRLWYERQKEDELAKLSRNIASAKAMLAKRNPDIPQYADSYNYFKAQRLVWIKDIKDGRKTQDEYREWLLYMQSQKRIKEAGDGID